MVSIKRTVCRARIALGLVVLLVGLGSDADSAPQQPATDTARRGTVATKEQREVRTAQKPPSKPSNPAPTTPALAQHFSLIEELVLGDNPRVISGESFYFTVILRRVSNEAAVPFQFSMHPILANGTLGNGFSVLTYSVPKGEKGETFTQVAKTPAGVPLRPGTYLVTASQVNGRVSKSAVIKVLPATSLPGTTPAYTPVVGITAEEAPEGTVIDGLFRVSVEPTIGQKKLYFFTVTTREVNEQEHGDVVPPNPPFNTTVVFQLAKEGSQDPPIEWKETKKLRVRKLTTTFHRFATTDGTAGGDALSKGRYVLRARRESHEQNEEWAETMIRID